MSVVDGIVKPDVRDKMAEPPTRARVLSNWRPVTVSVRDPVATLPRALVPVQKARLPGVDEVLICVAALRVLPDQERLVPAVMRELGVV